jgi:hypothetical protein
VRVRGRPIWVTSVTDDVDHAVRHESMAVGITSGAGKFEAVCGALVVPHSMTEPPHDRCLPCVAYLRAQRSLRDLERRMTPKPRHRTRRWTWSRLLGCR